jgi:hypothetical protein
MICNEEMLPNHDCLHIDLSDFSLEMELLSLSFVSAAEPEQYVVSLAPERSFNRIVERNYEEDDFGKKPVPMFLRM